MNAIEDFLLNQFAGKLLARACVTVAAALAAGPAANLLAQAGIHIAVDPVQLQAEAVVLGQAAFEWFKARRMANPNSPAVQTDASKQGAATAAPLPPTP